MTKTGTVPVPGDIIAGKYRVESTLGVGGMGAVLEVSHQVTQKRFAIKWLLPELCRSEDAAARFIREAQLVGSFDHRNVVQVYDLGQDDGAPFMVMELLHGESLANRIKRLGRLSAAETCAILIPCMQALSAAHAVGIIHRDVKPANIFLCDANSHSAEVPKLLDFGIAKLMPDKAPADAMRTQTGAIIGTPHYMAPEQMRGLPVDQRVDVYALGVTLYETLSGTRPFEANTYADLILKVGSEQLVPLERRVPDLPAGLGAVVARAMARDPDERFSSVDALLRELSRYASGHATASTRPRTISTLLDSVQPAQGSQQAEASPAIKTPMISESALSTASVPSGSTPWAYLAALLLLAFVAGGLVWSGRLGLVAQWIAERTGGPVQASSKSIRASEPGHSVHDAGAPKPNTQWVEPLAATDVRAATAAVEPAPVVEPGAEPPAVAAHEVTSPALQAVEPPKLSASQALTGVAPVPKPQVKPAAPVQPVPEPSSPASAEKMPVGSLHMPLQGEPTNANDPHAPNRPNVGLETDDFLLNGSGTRQPSRPKPHMDTTDF